MDAYKGLMDTEFGASGYETGIVQAENGQKVDEFQSLYLGKHRY